MNSESSAEIKYKMSTDYENIVRQCLKNGELWEDPDFAAVQGSVFYYQSTPFAFEWKRPPVREPFIIFEEQQFLHALGLENVH